MSYKVYVACIAAYNAGRLHGVWMDASAPPEDLHRQIQDMLKASPVPGAEEFRIDDTEGFGDIKADRLDVSELPQLCSMIEEQGLEIVGAAMDYVGAGMARVWRAYLKIQDSCPRIFQSDQEYGYYLFDGMGFDQSIPKELHSYFDYAAYGRDTRINNDHTHLDGERFVVWN